MGLNTVLMTKNHLHNNVFSTHKAHAQYHPSDFNADVQGNVFLVVSVTVHSVIHCLICNVMNAVELYSEYLYEADKPWC